MLLKFLENKRSFFRIKYNRETSFILVSSVLRYFVYSTMVKQTQADVEIGNQSIGCCQMKNKHF